MKKFRLFKALSIFAIAAAGAVAVGVGTKTPKVEAAEAAGSTTLYINQFDGGGNWNNFSYYLFNDSTGAKNANWPGLLFTDSMKTKTPNEYDQYQYVLEVPDTYDTLILVGNPSGWGGSQAQTDNLKISDMSNNGIYCGEQIPNTNKFYVGYYGYSTKTVYMLDLKGEVYSSKHYCHTFATGKSGTTWPGVEMTKVSGSKNLYSAEINSALQNVIFNNNGSNQTDTITNVSDGSTYIVYPDNGYNSSTLDAASFIDKYMMFETVWFDQKGTGLCKTNGWYSSAKSAFTTKTSDQKSAILAHEPTQYRFADWAKANGDTLDTSSGTITPSQVLGRIFGSNDDNGLVISIVLISILSVSALATFYIIRKRKHI